MATCTIRSVFSTSQNVKVDDYVPEAGNSTNSKFVAILNEGQTFNPEPQYITNLKAQNISFLEKNTGDLNNFNTIFPNGYTIMSTEMKYSKWISYRLTNRYSYSYKLNTTMLLLLSQTLSTLPFDLSCQICNSDDSLFQTVTLPSLSVGTAYIYATINATIPTGKYIQFRMRCPPPPAGQTASSPMPFQTLLNYLVISHTGTKVAVPEMTYDATSITSTYEKVAENSITLYLKPSLKGDNLAGHKVQFYANLNSQRTNLGEETIGAINVDTGKYSVTRNLANGTLPVGAYTISVELKRPATSPTNYVQNASTTVNALAYTVNKQKIVLTTTVVNEKVSYLGNFIINSSIDYKKSGTVSVKITANTGPAYVSNVFMALLQNGDYSYTNSVQDMGMTIGTTYTVETRFIPDSSVASNFEASDVKTVTFTIDSYKMVISVINNLTTIKYRESIEFNAIPKTGNDSAESQVTGDKSIVISKNGVVVETQSVPYTLTPYQTSLYSPGTYVAVAKFSNASAVLDSDAYTFTIEAQNTTLAVNSPEPRTIYGDANTSADDITTEAGVFTYAYNTPFTVSGVLKTGTVSELAKIQSGTPAQTIPIVIKDANNATVFDGEYTIDESGAVTSFKSGHGPSGTELLLAIDPANASAYYYDATNMTVNGLITGNGIALSSFPGMDTYLSVTNAPLWNFYTSGDVYIAANKVAGETTTSIEAGYSTNDSNFFSIVLDETASTFSIKDNSDNVLITLVYTKNGIDLTSLKKVGDETELLLPTETVSIKLTTSNGEIDAFNFNTMQQADGETIGNSNFAFSSVSTELATYFRQTYGSNYTFNNNYYIRKSVSQGLKLFTFYEQTVTTTTDSSFVDHDFSDAGLTATTQIVGGNNGDTITNFQLTRDTGSVDVSSRISNVTMVNGEDADGPTVVYTLKVSSPADIGVGLDTDTPVDFTLKWNPPNANYLLSTAAIKVKALKDFVELKIEAAQTSVKFEDNIVITCTVSNQEQDMTVPHPDLSGTYKLYRKKLLDATWPTEPILTQVDSLNTKTSVFTVPALELEIGTHMFYVDYVPSTLLSANFYPEIRAPANISIDVQKIDTNFAVKMIGIIEDEITSGVNVDQKVRFRVTDCKTQFGDGHAVAGTLSLISPVVTGFSTVTFSDNEDTNGDFDYFKIMELLIPKTTTSFVFEFKPTRSSHFNAKEITLNTTINSAGELPFIGSETDLANGSPTYLEDIVINLRITLASSARGMSNIPLSGKLELIKTDNSVESVIYNNNNENFTITGNNFVINTGKKPYDFGFTYNIPVSLKLRFTPTNDQYKYYTKYEKTVTIVSQEQTLQKINIITTKSTYTYGEKIGLSVNTGDSYPFTGKIEYYLQKVVNGSGVGDMSHIGDSDIVNASSTAVKEFVITHLEAGDANNASTPYQVTCKFVSNDVNFTDSVDNITQVVPQPIAHAKSTVKLTNLKFKYKNKNNLDVEEKNLETIYNNNIELLNSSTLTITGDISNSVSTDTRLVADGTVKVINRYTQEDGAVSTTVYKSAPVSNGTFTISYEPYITGEILLIYESTQNFVSNTNNLSQSPEFNTYYLILSNIPYDIEMSIGATVGVGITDYHDGSFTANVNMKNFLRSEDAKRAGNNQDKFLLTISNTNGDIVYSTKLELVEETSNTVGSFTFIPRKLSSTVPLPATTSLDTKGLEAGDYLLKVSYDGIAGFYDAEQANDSLIPANKFIRFTVAKTNPAIKSALTHRFNGNDNTLMAETKLDDDAAGYAMVQTTDDTASFFYRELPNMSIRVQTHRTTFATYNADNNLLGKTVVKFHHTSFPDLSTKGYKIVNITNTTGASGVSDNEITNIVDTKIVQLPLLDAGSVTFIELEFTPDDTRNYNSKNVLIRTEVKKYKPILLTGSDDYKINVKINGNGTPAGNIIDTRTYPQNVINYDEDFQVTNKLQSSDQSTHVAYTGIVGKLVFKYYANHNSDNLLDIDDGTIGVAVSDDKLGYLTTFNASKSTLERINIGGYTMRVTFEAVDLVNYEESDPVEREFDIYLANALGTIDISHTKHEAGSSDAYVFNVDNTIDLISNVDFNEDVFPQNGTLSFYYDEIKDSNILSTDKNIKSTGSIRVLGSDEYRLTINTENNNNVMLTARYDPYVILAKLIPDSNNYPTITQLTQLVARKVQINPSLVITISNINGGIGQDQLGNNLSSIEVGDDTDTIFITATLTHGNAVCNSGVANFTITNQDDGIQYIAAVGFGNNVATFNIKTDTAPVKNMRQANQFVSKFVMGVGKYVVSCQATFHDNNLYQDINEDYLNAYIIKNRTSAYGLTINKTNIVYGDERPVITTTFVSDNVYGGKFKYTIVYTSVEGVTTIEKEQSLTNTGNIYAPNEQDRPRKVYEFSLDNLSNDLTVGSYSIESSYSSPPNFSGNSSNNSNSSKFVYFVVNKKEVTINPLNNYYLSSLDTSRQFTLSATLNNPSITNSSVKFVNTTTNQVYSATHSGGAYSVTANGNDLLAGTYEIMAYFSGNFNYNKSNNVFSNLIVQRQQKAITLSVSSTVNASNEYTLDVNTVTGDTVYVYSTHQKEAIAVLSHTSDHLYKIADTLLNVGLNRIFVTVVHPNYSGSSIIVDITRPKMSVTVSLKSCNPDDESKEILFVQYKKTVTLKATVDVTGREYAVTEGETMDFYVNDSHMGTVDVVNNVATLPNVCLREMGANLIVAKFVNSKSYVSTSEPSVIVNVSKADIDVTLYNETSSVDKLNNKTISLCLGGLTPGNKTSTASNIVEFSHINSGTATFYNNNDIIYDNVPIINGIASISLSMDLASYSIKATFNGNDNYNESSSVSNANVEFNTTTQKAISDYYASVTLAEGSKNDGKTCYIVANVALKSGVASMPASSLLLNTGVVTFTFEGVTKIVNLVDGVATANFKSSSKDTLPTVVYSNTAYSGTLSPSSNAWPVDYLALDFLNSASRQYVNIFKTSQTTFDINKPFRFTQRCILTILVRAGTYIRYIDTSPEKTPIVTTTSIKNDDEYVTININIETGSFYVIFSPNTTSINMSYTSPFQYQGTWTFSSVVSLSISNGTIQNRSFSYYGLNGIRNDNETGIVSYTLS
jgi:hypothetical protein